MESGNAVALFRLCGAKRLHSRPSRTYRRRVCYAFGVAHPAPNTRTTLTTRAPRPFRNFVRPSPLPETIAEPPFLVSTKFGRNTACAPGLCATRPPSQRRMATQSDIRAFSFAKTPPFQRSLVEQKTATRYATRVEELFSAINCKRSDPMLPVILCSFGSLRGSDRRSDRHAEGKPTNTKHTHNNQENDLVCASLLHF